jgi:RNase H-like domain found in reverse transcriptase
VNKFSHITWLLTELTKKEEEWSWGSLQQQVFDELKQVLTTVPVLCLFNPAKTTRIEHNASENTWSGVLFQKQSDNQWYSVIYESHKFASNQCS